MSEMTDPLPNVRQRLMTEYAASVPHEEIDRAAEESVAAFSDAKIREFIPVLAYRQARVRLRQRAG